MLGLLLILTEAQSHITVPIRASRGFSSKSFSKATAFKESLFLTASVENSFNLQYNADFFIGTPNQTLSLVLDTGSSWIWVPGTTCDCHSSRRFDSEASSTYNTTGVSKLLEYGIGSVYGYLSKESIKIDEFTAFDQDFILSYKDNDLDGLTSDGLLGLGFNSLSEGYPTFIETLYNQGAIHKKVFSLYLNHYNLDSLESAFTIGGYDSYKYGQGSAKKVSIDKSYGFWLGIVQNTAIGGYSRANPSYGIYDIGTSLLMGPLIEVSNIKNTIKAKSGALCYDYGYLICACEQGEYEKYPDLVFTINNQAFTLSAKDYIYYESGYCFVLIDSTYDYYWIIGQPFFRAYYSVYDMQTPQILLYKAADGQVSETVAGPSEFYLLGISACGLIALAIGGLYYKNYKKNQEVNYTRIV